MGRGGNENAKKARPHPYMRPEQKTKSSDHKNSKESKDLNGSIKASLGASKMGKGGNENAKKGHKYMQPEQKMKSSDHKKSIESNDVVGSIIGPEQKMKSSDHKKCKKCNDVAGSIIGTGNIWEVRFSWSMAEPCYYNTIDRKCQSERPKELLFKHPHPSFENHQVINHKDPLGLINPLSDDEYRAHFDALPSSSSQKMWGKMSPENPSEQNRMGRFSNKAHFKDSDRKREQSIGRFTSNDAHLPKKQNTNLMKKDSGVEKDILEEDLCLSDSD